MKLHLRAVWRHLPCYGISQCYMPSDTSEQGYVLFFWLMPYFVRSTQSSQCISSVCFKYHANNISWVWMSYANESRL